MAEVNTKECLLNIKDKDMDGFMSILEMVGPSNMVLMIGAFVKDWSDQSVGEQKEILDEISIILRETSDDLNPLMDKMSQICPGDGMSTENNTTQ